MGCMNFFLLLQSGNFIARPSKSLKETFSDTYLYDPSLDLNIEISPKVLADFVKTLCTPYRFVLE